MKQLLLAFLLFFTLSSYAEGEIKFINFERIFGEYHENFKLYNQHKKYREELIASFKSKEAALKKLDEERVALEKKSVSIGVKSEERNTARQQAALALEQLRAESKNLQAMGQTIEQNIAKDQRRIYLELYQKLTNYLVQYRDRKKYLLIIDISAKGLQGQMCIPAYDKSQEITEEVLAELNKGYEEFVKTELENQKKNKLEEEAKRLIENKQ